MLVSFTIKYNTIKIFLISHLTLTYVKINTNPFPPLKHLNECLSLFFNSKSSPQVLAVITHYYCKILITELKTLPGCGKVTVHQQDPAPRVSRIQDGSLCRRALTLTQWQGGEGFRSLFFLFRFEWRHSRQGVAARGQDEDDRLVAVGIGVRGFQVKWRNL
jgi:hypothetical protein